MNKLEEMFDDMNILLSAGNTYLQSKNAKGIKAVIARLESLKVKFDKAPYSDTKELRVHLRNLNLSLSTYNAFLKTIELSPKDLANLESSLSKTVAKINTLAKTKLSEQYHVSSLLKETLHTYNLIIVMDSSKFSQDETKSFNNIVRSITVILERIKLEN